MNDTRSNAEFLRVQRERDLYLGLLELGVETELPAFLEGALALIVGVVVGTYSSIYVAANSLLMLGISKEDLMIPVREGAQQDELP